MVETLVKHMKTSRGGCPPLIDYAYGGAIIDNTIGTAKPVPAGADQVKMYLSDIKSKAIKRGKGRVLHVNFNGIKCVQLLRSHTQLTDSMRSSPITAIWLDWQGNGNTTAATGSVTANVRALLKQTIEVDGGARGGGVTQSVEHLS